LGLSPKPTRAARPVGISRLRRWASLVICVLLLSLSFAFAAGRFRTFRVMSNSMLPTIQVGDCLLVNASGPAWPRRGDIVAVKNPKDPLEWLCKRVVAEPFDVWGFRDGFFFLNGEWQFDEGYVSSHRVPDLPDMGPRRLEADEYFVLGDNRPLSYDSVEFGPVHSEDFIGNVVGIYWPPKRMRILRRPGEKTIDAGAPANGETPSHQSRTALGLSKSRIRACTGRRSCD
jgi:signal peptidase I